MHSRAPRLAAASFESGWCLLHEAAGLCIGLAEIGYFYIYRGAGGQAPIAANVAVPIIVSSTITITAIAS